MIVEGKKIIFDYDETLFCFNDIFKQYLSSFGIDRLENFHSECSKAILTNEVVTVKNDQLAPVYKILYEIDKGFDMTKSHNPELFLKTFKDFIYYISSEIFKEDLVYQRRPTLRIQFPNNKAVGGFHRDREYNHPIEEVNIWVPLTPAFNTNTIWIESEFDKEDYSPMNLNFGQGVIFDSGLKHGNKVNVENLTRLSFDFRVIPLSKWMEIKNENSKYSRDQHLKFELNEYYDVTS